LDCGERSGGDQASGYQSDSGKGNKMTDKQRADLQAMAADLEKMPAGPEKDEAKTTQALLRDIDSIQRRYEKSRAVGNHVEAPKARSK